MKRTQYPIHPDFKKWTNMNPPLNRAMLPAIQRSLGILFTMEKSTANLTVERKIIPVGNGDTIRALWYCPKEIAENAPCLVYYHGGGFVWPASPYHYSLEKVYAPNREAVAAPRRQRYHLRCPTSKSPPRRCTADQKAPSRPPPRQRRTSTARVSLLIYSQ